MSQENKQNGNKQNNVDPFLEVFLKQIEKHQELLDNIKANLPELEKLLEDANSHWGYEDPIYRFYYQSFKVYWLQDETQRIVDALKSIAPEGTDFCVFFKEIIEKGTGKQFRLEHNERWTHHTRPIVEAFFHTRFFLEMAVKYGKELIEPPDVLPSGWAALLCLYRIR